MKNGLLQVGDVFELKKGMPFYAWVPAKFVYSNTPFSDELCETDLKAGEVRFRNAPVKKSVVKKLIKIARDYSDFEGVKFDEAKMEEAITLLGSKKSELDTSDYLGEYVVVASKFCGGGTGMGPHDVYPDGWFVIAHRLNNGKYDSQGKKITFYQTGAFNAMNPDVPVVRTLKINFK